jgi:hypothetical protein
MTENNKLANLNSEAIRQIIYELLLILTEEDILCQKLRPKLVQSTSIKNSLWGLLVIIGIMAIAGLIFGFVVRRKNR